MHEIKTIKSMFRRIILFESKQNQEIEKNCAQIGS